MNERSTVAFKNSQGLRRTVWLLLVLTLLPLAAYGSDATGLMRFANCNLTNRYRLTLTRYRKQNLDSSPQNLRIGSSESPCADCVAGERSAFSDQRSASNQRVS